MFTFASRSAKYRLTAMILIAIALLCATAFAAAMPCGKAGGCVAATESAAFDLLSEGGNLHCYVGSEASMDGGVLIRPATSALNVNRMNSTVKRSQLALSAMWLWRKGVPRRAFRWTCSEQRALLAARRTTATVRLSSIRARWWQLSWPCWPRVCFCADVVDEECRLRLFTPCCSAYVRTHIAHCSTAFSFVCRVPISMCMSWCDELRFLAVMLKCLHCFCFLFVW